MAFRQLGCAEPRSGQRLRGKFGRNAIRTAARRPHRSACRCQELDDSRAVRGLVRGLHEGGALELDKPHKRVLALHRCCRCCRCCRCFRCGVAAA
jgi:hypothetical protein